MVSIRELKKLISENNGMRGQRRTQGFGRREPRVVTCWICNVKGHILKFCDTKYLNRNNVNYTKAIKITVKGIKGLLMCHLYKISRRNIVTWWKMEQER